MIKHLLFFSQNSDAAYFFFRSPICR
uniref:Uncharacterized protein n=1 Tax=Arundo donax TaxID=35708 RepID=A0A0A9BWM8_ARUDO